MLHEFIARNRQELEQRCRAKVATRASPTGLAGEQAFGIPLFIGQLIETLRDHPFAPREPAATTPTLIGTTAGKHGHELHRKGFTIEQVVHDYGDLCQALTELAAEKREPITVDEFHTFNRCLDNAMADAVTEFGRARDETIADASHAAMNERLGLLAHELRNELNTAMLALGAIKTGSVALAGATGAVLDRSLFALRDLIDRALADVRLTAGLEPKPVSVSIEELVREIGIPVTIEAATRHIVFATAVEAGLTVDADRPMLASALANLVQNAVKFTREYGHVGLTARRIANRIVIDIADECGGLPPGRPGLGLGLSISRRGIEANHGTLAVRDIPGTGCVFTITLPRPKRSVGASESVGG